MLQAKPPRFPCPARWPVHHVSPLTFSVVRYAQSGRLFSYRPFYMHSAAYWQNNRLPACCLTVE